MIQCNYQEQHNAHLSGPSIKVLPPNDMMKDFAQRFTDIAITGLFDQLRQREHIYRNVKEQEEKEKEEAETCTQCESETATEEFGGQFCSRWCMDMNHFYN